MPFVAFLDANVLFPAVLRDVLLSIAEHGICQVRWSPDVLDEMERNIAGKARTGTPTAAAGGARYVRQTMELAFPEAMVERDSYTSLIPAMINHAKDRHVLAAAIAGRADVIVTFNTKHFPPECCGPYNIDVQDPDTFLVHQFGLLPSKIVQVLTTLPENRVRKPMNTVEGILQALEKQVPRFCSMAMAKLKRI